MKTLILDGAHSGDAMAGRILAALRTDVPDAEVIHLREKRIGNCAGDFYCWVRSPGMCNVDDDNRVIAARIVQSDLLVYLTPVTFGGYSSALKRMVDHQIQNISPMFACIDGETHHRKRYERNPNLCTIGWMAAPDEQVEAVFRHLVHRSAINLYAETSVCGVVTESVSDASLTVQTRLLLEAVARGESTPVPALPENDASAAEVEPVGRAVLLVGSPRTRNSTSFSVGGYLMERLSARGIETEVIQIYTAFSTTERTERALEALDSADLIVLAFPLYVDSLPAPVIAALEKIAAHRSGRTSPQRFAAIANCGFPEARHNETALAICAQFARRNGVVWVGGLAIGGGEGLVHGVPLNELGGRVAPLRKSLELAAEALAEGRRIPQSACDLLARPVIPNWAYRTLGGFGWKRQAKRFGASRLLNRQPYLATERSA